jgi:hypothetical protein
LELMLAKAWMILLRAWPNWGLLAAPFFSVESFTDSNYTAVLEAKAEG